MKKFAFLSDILFTFFVSATLSLVFFRYLHVGLTSSLLLALLCGGLTALAVGAILAARRKQLYLKKSDETLKQKLLLHLALLSDEKKTEYFRDVLSTEEEPANRFGKLRIFTKREFYFLKFTLSPLSADEIPNLARLKTGKKKILLCSRLEDTAAELCRRLHIEVRTGEWVYERLKTLNALPETYLGEDTSAQKRKNRLRLCFARKNAKRFLVGGALVLLLSRLTPFYLYYLLLGGILVLAAVFIRIFGYDERVTD